MYTGETMYFGNNRVIRLDLEKEDAPRDLLFDSIKPLWLLYEPWATDVEIRRMITKKAGRKIDVVFDRNDSIRGFLIFRLFRHQSLKIMFRGNSYLHSDVRGLGAHLFNRTINQYRADRIVSFTQQERVYAFLSHFGETLPDYRKPASDCEYQLLTQLAGSKYIVDKNTLIVRNFYRHHQEPEGGPVRNERVRKIFSRLGSRDAFAIVVRRS